MRHPEPRSEENGHRLVRHARRPRSSPRRASGHTQQARRSGEGTRWRSYRLRSRIRAARRPRVSKRARECGNDPTAKWCLPLATPKRRAHIATNAFGSAAMKSVSATTESANMKLGAVSARAARALEHARLSAGGVAGTTLLRPALTPTVAVGDTRRKRSYSLSTALRDTRIAAMPRQIFHQLLSSSIPFNDFSPGGMRLSMTSTTIKS